MELASGLRVRKQPMLVRSMRFGNESGVDLMFEGKFDDATGELTIVVKSARRGGLHVAEAGKFIDGNHR